MKRHCFTFILAEQLFSSKLTCSANPEAFYSNYCKCEILQTLNILFQGMTTEEDLRIKNGNFVKQRDFSIE